MGDSSWSNNTRELKQTCQCGSDDLLIRSKGPHVGAWCNSCGKWLRWLPQNKSLDLMPFGCQKNVPIASLPTDYLDFLLTSDVRISTSLRARLEA
jgi:hypothetical protein